MTRSQVNVTMSWADADLSMGPLETIRDATEAMAVYAATKGLVLISAPSLAYTPQGLHGVAHARRRGNHPYAINTYTAEPPLPACAGHPDAYMWTSEDPGDRNDAANVCTVACPVLDACLAGALGRKEKFGIFGGVDMADVKARHRAVAS